MNIVFDLDGTLVDTAPDLRVAVNRMLAGESLAPLDLATITGFIGNGLPRLVERAMRARGLARDDFERLYEAVERFYSAAPADESRPMPGVPALLEKLKADGHRLGICTNKPEAPARKLLNLLALEEFFDTIVGGDTLPEKKPDPAPLNLAFDRLGEGARLYVGDTGIDADVALAAGVPFAIYARGYCKEAIESVPHSYRFDHFEALGALVDALAAAEPAV